MGNVISSGKKTPHFDRECAVLSFIIMNDSVCVHKFKKQKGRIAMQHVHAVKQNAFPKILWEAVIAFLSGLSSLVQRLGVYRRRLPIAIAVVFPVPSGCGAGGKQLRYL